MTTVTAKCPHCGGTSLSEVRSEINATLISSWAWSLDTKELIGEDVIEQETYDTDVIRYECKDCGKDIEVGAVVVLVGRKQVQP